ncbi:MAG: hypothetical protein ACRD93_09165, partial [Nitrososphaeraceae archaeon]
MTDKIVNCAECNCSFDTCEDVTIDNCSHCSKTICCCLSIHTKKKQYSILKFFYHTKTLLPAAIGIELLCISAAEIGENSGLYLFGYNIKGIIIAYLMGYGLAGFTTFVTILGRHDFRNNSQIDTCCSLLEQQSNSGFLLNVLLTCRNFGIGLSKLPKLSRRSNMRQMLKTSIIIL